ncbi:MAG: IclR family transcriptional regulator [Acidobacteriota bacterium]
MSIAEDNSSTAVERALGILEAVSQRSAGMTNSEISRKLAIPKSSASYILRTLEKRGYLARERGTGKYKLGLKALSLGSRIDVGGDLKQAALPVLRRLVERYKLTAHLAVLDHNEAVYIEKVEAPGFIKMDTWVGKRMEVHSTAVGKALLAHLSSEEAEAIIKEQGLRRFTAKTITTRAGLMADLEKVRRKGYSVDDEENNVGARCVAAPVFDSLGRVVASIGVSATVTQIDRSSIAKIAEAVKQAAREVSRQLGYQADSKR